MSRMLLKVLIVCLLGSTLADVYRIGLNKEVRSRKTPEEASANGQKLEYVALDHVYIGTVSLGTPLQDVNVVFDTESGIFWVPDDKCPCDEECSNEPVCIDICSSHCCSQGGGNLTLLEDDTNPAPVGVCTHKNVFNRKESRSYISRRASTVEPFLNKSITLNLAYETFRLGPHHAGGFTMKYLQFGHASDFPDEYEHVQFDGIFGLGRIGPKGSKAPIKQLADNRIIPNPVVTLFLNNEYNTERVYDGVLTVGQIDETYCYMNQSGFLPVASADRWNLRVFAACLHANVTDLTWTAKVDPSWPYVTIPQKLWDQYLKDKVTVDPETGRYIGPCKPMGTILNDFYISIGFERHRIYAYTRLDHEAVLCEALVRPAGRQTDQWVLGTPFLRDRCVALDYNGRILVSQHQW